MSLPNCPICNNPLHRNEYLAGNLNKEAWNDDSKSAPYYCTHCKDSRSVNGHKYFFQHEVENANADILGAWKNGHRGAASDPVTKAVIEVVMRLHSRRGFDDWWDNLGDELQEEILKQLWSSVNRFFPG